jgi:hypothetical protein
MPREKTSVIGSGNSGASGSVYPRGPACLHGWDSPRNKGHSTPPNVRRHGPSRRLRSYWRVLEALEMRRLKCVDASRVNRAMTHLYGRTPQGERGVGTVCPSTTGKL